jgi:hypothetical protein
MTSREKEIADAIAKMMADGKLPRGLSAAQVDKLAIAVENSIGDVAEKSLLGKILAAAQTQIQEIASATEPEVRRGLLADLGNYLQEDGMAAAVYKTLDLTHRLFGGAGAWLQHNFSEGAVNNYPGLAFQREIEVDVPRGSKMEKKTLVEVPDDDWPSRWAEAGEACGDDDWLEWEGDAQTGRGVALKSSKIWGLLCTLRPDTTGNPEIPAWETGFRPVDLSRAECVELGLLGADDEAKPSPIKFENLFPSPA